MVVVKDPNKYVFKGFEKSHLKSKKYNAILENTDNDLIKKVERYLQFPVVVKPINEGSSVNVFICSKKNFLDKVKKLNSYKKVIIEVFTVIYCNVLFIY